MLQITDRYELIRLAVVLMNRFADMNDHVDEVFFHNKTNEEIETYIQSVLHPELSNTTIRMLKELWTSTEGCHCSVEASELDIQCFEEEIDYVSRGLILEISNDDCEEGEYYITLCDNWDGFFPEYLLKEIQHESE